MSCDTTNHTTLALQPRICPNSSVGLSYSWVGSNVSASDPSRFLERNVRRNDTHRTEIMYQKLLRAIPNIQPGSIFDVGSPSAEQNQI
jgi:hypothetical protein